MPVPRPSMQPVVTGDPALDEASRLIALAARIHARGIEGLGALSPTRAALPALHLALTELESAALLVEDARALLLERDSEASLAFAGTLEAGEAALAETRHLLATHLATLNAAPPTTR